MVPTIMRLSGSPKASTSRHNRQGMLKRLKIEPYESSLGLARDVAFAMPDGSRQELGDSRFKSPSFAPGLVASCAADNI